MLARRTEESTRREEDGAQRVVMIAVWLVAKEAEIV